MSALYQNLPSLRVYIVWVLLLVHTEVDSRAVSMDVNYVILPGAGRILE